jgi:hypothetical protein
MIRSVSCPTTHPNQARLHHTTTTKPAISYSSCPDRHQKQSHQDTYQTHHVGTHLHQRRLQTCQLTMGGNGFTTAPASASSHTTPCSFSGKEPKKKRICALPGFLSYQHPSTTGPKYRNHDRIRESTSRAQQQQRTHGKTDAKPSRKPAVCRSWPVVHTYVSCLDACLPTWRSQHRTARAPSPREAPHMGQKQRHFLRETTRYGVCCRRMSCRETQVRLGEAGFPRAIEHPRVWELESWGREESVRAWWRM